MNEDCEVFVGITEQGRKKSYFVAKDQTTALGNAKKALKVATYHILVEVAWIVGDYLYFTNPKKKGQKKVFAASYWK